MAWVHVVLDLPGPAHAAAMDFWGAALTWPAGAPWPGHPELRSFEPPAGAPYVHLQEISGPARVHVDLETGAPDALVARAVARGAELVADREGWRTLRSPGGLPFCVLNRSDRAAPPPAAFPDGHLTRLVQVSIDSPRLLHRTELAFWRALLPGRWVGSRFPGFSGTWHDDAGSPIQLHFQELDEPTGRVRAHLDLGSDNRPAEVRRLRALGAGDVGCREAGPLGGWHVLRDPAGLPFCVTDHAPEQTRQRDLGRRVPGTPPESPQLWAPGSRRLSQPGARP